MQHVVTLPAPPLRSSSGRLEIHLVPVWQDNLVWLILPADSDEAWAVDGPEAGPVLSACSALGRRLTGVLNTHTHHDHIGINRDLHERGALSAMQVVGSRRPADPIPGQTRAVDRGDRVEIGGVEGRVLLTEGHQDGHVSYLFEDLLFCGDTLFTGGCGYLFDGPPAAMFDSLLRLAEIPGSTRVCCAHEYTQDNLRFAWMLEPDNAALADRIQKVWERRAEGACVVPSTIEEERATNPFLRPGSPRLIREIGERMPEADLSTPLGVFTAARRLKDRKDHRKLTDDDLPLR